MKHKIILIIKWIIALIVIVLIIGYLILKSSVVDYDQDIPIKNIDHNIDIIRDTNAIPHIYASSLTDAYFGLGFAHAQDRLWQLEIMRAAVNGELSEIFGETTVLVDKLTRTVNSAKIAKMSLARVDEQTKHNFQRYVDGINSYIDHHTGVLPAEFLIFSTEPTKWTLEDCFAFYGLISLGANNWQAELQRAFMQQTLSSSQIYDLFPEYPRDGVITHSNFEPNLTKDELAHTSLKQKNTPNKTINGLSSLASLSSLANHPLIKSFPASNTWVISGSKTVTGKPILASDPHGPIKAPADYYLAHLHGPDFDLTGVVYVGMPIFAIGHNQNIAWGITDVLADRADLFWEKIVPEKPGYYVTQDGIEPFITHQGTIKVKGQEDIVFTVRNTIHGPVISDVQEEAGQIVDHNGKNRVLVLSEATFLYGNTSSQAFMNMNQAKNWAEFNLALDDYELSHNFSYADIKGNIGMVSPMKVPIRHSSDGFNITEGWLDSSSIDGYLTAKDMLSTYNPKQGFIVNSNNKTEPWNYPYFISKEHETPFRATRITQQLEIVKKQSIASTETLQNDVVSLDAKKLIPILLKTKTRTDQHKKIIKLLSSWDQRMDKNKIEPLLYLSWERELSRLILEDELGENFSNYYASKPAVIFSILKDKNQWCDYVTTTVIESCHEILTQSLQSSLDNLTEELGGDMDHWRWGDAHQAIFSNDIFTSIPLINNFSDVMVSNSGGPYTVNTGKTDYNSKQPFVQNYGPRYRQIIDLSDLSNSRYMIAPGVSGNIFSPFYRHLSEQWSNGEYFKLPSTKTELLEQTVGITKLLKTAN
ncbi:MAG: penicillin acylase family protein [Pseudomonadota bacterium]